MNSPNKNLACYPHKPIASLDALARHLGVQTATLREIAAAPAQAYTRPFPIPKKSGGNRTVVAPKAHLKRIQTRILRRLLDRAVYPSYLKGGVRNDSIAQRGAEANARVHLRSAILVNLDARSFFPSISAALVRRVWLQLFHCAPEVADCLTALTTLDGVLPQGAPTSAALGNLAMFDQEPALVETLGEMGFQYTRYIDDISVSARSRVSADQIEQAIALVIGTLAKHGLRIAREKLQIASQQHRQLVTGHIINRRLAIQRHERAKVRAAFLQEQQAVTTGTLSSTSSTAGRLKYVRRLHRRWVEKLAVSIGHGILASTAGS
jgi:hypothetical protein